MGVEAKVRYICACPLVSNPSITLMLAVVCFHHGALAGTDVARSTYLDQVSPKSARGPRTIPLIYSFVHRFSPFYPFRFIILNLHRQRNPAPQHLASQSRRTNHHGLHHQHQRHSNIACQCHFPPLQHHYDPRQQHINNPHHHPFPPLQHNLHTHPRCHSHSRRAVQHHLVLLSVPHHRHAC